MEIVDIAVNNLVPYDKNPRRNDEAAVKVAESIKQFGFKIPLVVDRNNVVVCGHTRLKAAKKLKLKTVPCILADDLSEDQIKAFRLVDNRTAEIAEWDFALLEEELADVQLDMTAFDFDDLLAEEEAGSENGQAPVGAEREEESALLPPHRTRAIRTRTESSLRFMKLPGIARKCLPWWIKAKRKRCWNLLTKPRNSRMMCVSFYVSPPPGIMFCILTALPNTTPMPRPIFSSSWKIPVWLSLILTKPLSRDISACPNDWPRWPIWMNKAYRKTKRTNNTGCSGFLLQ